MTCAPSEAKEVQPVGWGSRAHPLAHSVRTAKGGGSVQGDDPVDGLELRRLDKARVCHRNGVERPMKLADPKVEELVEDGKLRSEVVLLPDEGLQERGVVRHPVQDVGGRQAVALELPDEILRDHKTSFPRK